MATNDVKTLFRRFGGDASAYQEIVSRDQVSQAEEKWPMLGQIKPTTPHEAPSARRVAPTLTRRVQEDSAAAPTTTMPSEPDKAEKVLGLPMAASVPFARSPTDPSPHATGRTASPSSAFLGLKKTNPEEKSLGGAFQSMLPPHRAAPPQPDAVERLAVRAPASGSSTNTPSAGHNMFSAFLNRGTGGQSGQGGAKGSKTVGSIFLGGSSPSRGALTIPAAPPKQPVHAEVDTVLGRKLSGLGGVGNPVERVSTVAPTPLAASQKINNDLQQSFGKLVSPKPNPPLNTPKEVVANKRLTKW
jgi:hypothetical protein